MYFKTTGSHAPLSRIRSPSALVGAPILWVAERAWFKTLKQLKKAAYPFKHLYCLQNKKNFFVAFVYWKKCLLNSHIRASKFVFLHKPQKVIFFPKNFVRTLISERTCGILFRVFAFWNVFYAMGAYTRRSQSGFPDKRHILASRQTLCSVINQVLEN
jgi:hypothetical protein